MSAQTSLSCMAGYIDAMIWLKLRIDTWLYIQKLRNFLEGRLHEAVYNLTKKLE